MSDMHWTGAVVLLALAVLGTGRAAAPRDPCVSWAEFIRQRPVNTTGRHPGGDQEGLR